MADRHSMGSGTIAVCAYWGAFTSESCDKDTNKSQLFWVSAYIGVLFSPLGTPLSKERLDFVCTLS